MSRMRFNSLNEFQDYLEKQGDKTMEFRAIPISGEPEEFYYDGHKKVVTRNEDGKMFDNVEDFLCYTFQCDEEGYTHTEHVDVELKIQ
ncbi:MAG: hypothetical protein FH758_03510 [Firmicutes bacterium]|nr:hypothetical protein [Bacillota bacterium]